MSDNDHGNAVNQGTINFGRNNAASDHRSLGRIRAGQTPPQPTRAGSAKPNVTPHIASMKSFIQSKGTILYFILLVVIPC